MFASSNQSILTKTVFRLRPYFLISFALSVGITLLSLVPIWYMRDVYGPVMDSGSLTTLGMVTVLLAFCLLISAGLGLIRSRALGIASLQLAEQLSRLVFDASFTGMTDQVKGSKRALSDLKSLRSFIVSATMPALLEAPLGLIFLILVFFIHPIMGLVSLAAATIVLVVSWRSEVRVRPLVKESQAHYSEAVEVAVESSRNAQVIEAMGMRKAIQERWLSRQNKFLFKNAVASNIQAFSTVLSRSIMMGQGSMVLGLGVALTIGGILSPEAGAYLIIGKILGMKAIAPLIQVMNSWKAVVAALDAYERLNSFLEEAHPRPEGMPLPAPKGSLIARNVFVRPPSVKKPTLSDISLVAKPGSVTAIVGKSGSGKSTLLRALLGIWPPTHGSIRLDGAEINLWNKGQLGSFLGYLPQDVELFDGTIAENIARFGVINDSLLKKAVSLAGISSLIAAMPEGVNTDIGEGGSILSGGQRQRIGIARAIYGDPHLIVLDEPNSSLDLQGERDLVGAIEALKAQGSVIILVTHRQSLLEISDQLLVIANGKTRLFGPTKKIQEQLVANAARQRKESETAARKEGESSQGQILSI